MRWSLSAMSCSLVTLPSVHNPCLSQLYWGGGGYRTLISVIPSTYISWHSFAKKSSFFLTCHPYFYLSMLHSIAWVHWMLQLSQTGPAGTSFKLTFLLTLSPLNDSSLSDIQDISGSSCSLSASNLESSHFSKEPSLLSEGKGI